VFAVRDRDLARTRNGKDYLRLKLGDSTGIVPAVCWEDAPRCFEVAAQGAVVRVEGRFSVSSQYGPQIKIDRIAPASEDSYEPEDLLASTGVPIERLEADMRELIATIQNRDLAALLDRFFGAETESWRRFRQAPAAKIYHQAYTGGLLEHTLSVAQAVSAASAYFPGIDRDIAVTGALLHDIGKTEAYNDDPLAIDLTDAGRLEGEIPLGYYKVRRAIEDIDGFDRASAQHVLHIILSHHGSLEHGSPVVPATREATLVHMLDNLGGTLGSFDRLERELPEGERWSRFDRGISGAAFFARRAA
jgi:3'-5' exoribonuclease